MIKITKLPDPHIGTVIIANGDELKAILGSIHDYWNAYKPGSYATKDGPMPQALVRVEQAMNEAGITKDDGWTMFSHLLNSK